jgi:argininosuccinate lyase
VALAEKTGSPGRSGAKAGKPLNQLTLAELQGIDKTFGRDALGVFNLKTAMAKRNLTGAPGTKEVAKQLARWQEQLS